MFNHDSNYWENVFISLYGKEQIMNICGICIEAERADNKIKEEKGDKK